VCSAGKGEDDGEKAGAVEGRSSAGRAGAGDSTLATQILRSPISSEEARLSPPLSPFVLFSGPVPFQIIIIINNK
jgi:hypothetical protein